MQHSQAHSLHKIKNFADLQGLHRLPEKIFQSVNFCQPVKLLGSEIEPVSEEYVRNSTPTVAVNDQIHTEE